MIGLIIYILGLILFLGLGISEVLRNPRAYRPGEMLFLPLFGILWPFALLMMLYLFIESRRG